MKSPGVRHPAPGPLVSVLLLAVLGACGGDSAATTVPGASTSAPPTTSVATTSTPAAPTTSVATTPTRPEDVLSVVVSRYGLMGWWDGEWVVPEGLSDVPVEGGERYQVVMLDQPQSNAIGSSARLCEPSQTPVLDLDPPLPGGFGDVGAIAVLSNWELRPSPVTVVGELIQEHRDAVLGVLEPLGILSEPEVYQQLVVDLEGDGTQEVIIVVKQVAGDLFAQPGDYSVVLLRKVVEGEWQTAVLETSLAQPDSPYILSHSVAAVADLNGDGKMEIAIDAVYYEGSGSVAYEYVDNDIGAQAVLNGGCGA